MTTNNTQENAASIKQTNDYVSEIQLYFVITEIKIWKHTRKSEVIMDGKEMKTNYL